MALGEAKVRLPLTMSTEVVTIKSVVKVRSSSLGQVK
jgi:hypothetical protein